MPALLLLLAPAGATAQEPDWPPLDAWLLQRQTLCAQSPSQRRQWIAQARRESEPAASLGLLLAASCAPPTQPALLAEALARVEALTDAPPAYRALFTLLAEHAGTAAELERQRRRLRTELDRTIRGISDIETGIDARDGKGDEERRSGAKPP